ncbi:MAG: HAD hydrolase family protein [Clostridiales bacterium]|nr:HAD hydrolase family protein [Clostridiales bacterium]
MKDAFISDLDNTLIYSYKKNIGGDTINVEVYEGREISFMTRGSYEALCELGKHICFIPLTTRSLKQFQRINFGRSQPKYALTSNGGTLLVDGVEDEKFKKDSLELIQPALPEMEKARKILGKDKNLILDIYLVDDFFLYSKSKLPTDSLENLKDKINLDEVSLLQNGEKIYVIPKKLNKGTAVTRVKEYLKLERIIAAGDSLFDIPMLEAADIAFSPSHLHHLGKQKPQWLAAEEDIVFSDYIFKHMIDFMV